jgi:tRNA (cytidine/uridine-2'-O-)-methyltransferase
MFDVVLHQPRIPPNTGNIIRLCANTGCDLHLVEPLGFALDDKQLRRAGLDYDEYCNLEVWPSWQTFLRKKHEKSAATFNTYMLSTHHRHPYSEARYAPGDVLVFGAETTGLPLDIRNSVSASQQLCLPMRAGNRSLNLANTVAVVVYEAWRQNGFASD